MCVIALDGETISSAEQRDVQERERSKSQEQRRQHLSRKRRRARLEQDRLWMQRPEEVHAQMNERDQQRSQYPQDRAVSRAHRAIFDRASQNHVRDVDEPQKKCERETSVPGPPRAPDGLAPYRTANQNH